MSGLVPVMVWLLVMQTSDGGLMSEKFANQADCERVVQRQEHFAYKRWHTTRSVSTCTQVTLMVPAIPPAPVINIPPAEIKVPPPQVRVIIKEKK